MADGLIVLKPKARTPRVTGPPIDITETQQRNNGNVEIVNSDISIRQEEKISVDEVLINGRKYRVPERIIVLDFWDKIRPQRARKFRFVFEVFLLCHIDSIMSSSKSASLGSSPLTSLSSLDDQMEHLPPPLKLNEELVDSDDDTLQIAGVRLHFNLSVAWI